VPNKIQIQQPNKILFVDHIHEVSPGSKDPNGVFWQHSDLGSSLQTKILFLFL